MPTQPLSHLVLGQLRRDFLITPQNKIIIDQLGGNLLYAAEGVKLWVEEEQGNIGLVSRVGEDYPRAWLDEIAAQGYNIEGLHILPEEIDLRYFRAYSDIRTVHEHDPIAHFTRLGKTMPKTLLGYSEKKLPRNLNQISNISLRRTDLPEDISQVKAAHLCAMDYLSHTLIPAALRQAGVGVVTLDPGNYMQKEYWREVQNAAIGLTAFMPSEDELREVFRGRTSDLFEMIEEVSSWGVEIVVVKRSWEGQTVYDSASKKMYEVSAYPSKVVDLTGAGDVFAGGFLAGLATAQDLLEAVLYGNVAASFAVEGTGVFYTRGALPGLKTARLEHIRQSVREL